ncbi:vanomycin resistance protein VanB [Paenibacillus psychroresistens]|uniref:Vanomycin resistance protein VanB n=1 Tax=Paenibacillus psychroresistens TaxID=1778678 RepID=A0A6B8RDL6_9BACL|nr:VanW family protein [Paenibacillus psychroresistens]QGQ93548.1 vanomycin resistance protein VanB [Paenibacillus psychroresistens]
MRIKPVYLIGSVLISLLLACFLVFTYGSKHTVPRNVTLSGWSLNGITLAQFDLQLKNTMTLIERQQVLFTCSGTGCEQPLSKKDPFRQAFWKPSAITLHEMGVSGNLTEIAAILHSVEKGPWYKRAWKRWHLSNSQYSVKLIFDENKLLSAINQKGTAANTFKPINAYRKIETDDSIKITPEINAYRVDSNELNKLLKAELSSKDSLWLLHLRAGKPLPMQVRLPLLVKPPAVTAVSLKKQGITRNISQFSTVFATGAAGRIHNISVSAQTMQDQLLAPGEIFDYSQIIRQTEKKLGYQEAPVIYNGKLVPGIGGGICQVSTTLYNAVLRAGLQIIERRNHSLPISYVPLGQDATYATDYINFRFKNNTGHYLLIRTSVVNNKLTVKLFGTLQQEKTYEVKSNIVKKIPPSMKYLYNASLAPMETQTLQAGKTGYVVETYRLEKLAGVMVKRELISKDTYPSQPTLVAVGEGGRAKVQPQEQNLLEDGVSGPNFRR